MEDVWIWQIDYLASYVENLLGKVRAYAHDGASLSLVLSVGYASSLFLV